MCYSRHETDGYLFDTLHGSFVKNATSPPYKWKLIDTARNVFCSLDFNLKEDYGISLLYTYKNLQIYPYFYLKIDDNDDQTKKTLTLYRCINGDIENLKQIMHTDMDTDNYDFYENFWKLCYKGLHY